MIKRRIIYPIVWCLISVVAYTSCVSHKKISKKSLRIFSKDSITKRAHIGIAVWNLADQQYILQYHSDRYFVPASNVKIATLYTALKYLPDSLPSFDFFKSQDTLFLLPKGDPSFLNTDFPNQPAVDFLKKENKPVVILPVKWETEIFGKGWAWDDYRSAYMPEKSPMPVYKKNTIEKLAGSEIIFPSLQNKYDSAANVLSNILDAPVLISNNVRSFNEKALTCYTTSRDSVCKKMMFDSDNLIAEQLLLMTSNMLSGSMHETKPIELLLSDNTNQFPQKPVWVDGSGLSRYNLFTPEDMIFLLQKIEKEFGSTKVEAIFPTGNKGTLKGYYDDKAGFIYAKTGTLSGQLSLSGYLTTKKKTPLIFSIMINNHTGKSSEVREKIAKFIDVIWSNY